MGDALILERRPLDDFIVARNEFKGKPGPELDKAWQGILSGMSQNGVEAHQRRLLNFARLQHAPVSCDTPC